MAIITEDYVSFETAKLLKEKGFDEPCYESYSYSGGNVRVRASKLSNTDLCYHPDISGISAPTLQMTMKWLREVHNLFIEMHIQNNGSYIGYIDNTNGFGLIGWDKRRVSSSYEQALEAAIKYCLENLI